MLRAALVQRPEIETEVIVDGALLMHPTLDTAPRRRHPDSLPAEEPSGEECASDRPGG